MGTGQVVKRNWAAAKVLYFSHREKILKFFLSQ